MDDLKIPRVPFALPAIEAETLKTDSGWQGNERSDQWRFFWFLRTQIIAGASSING